MYRIGLIGCGWFAPFHLTALQSLRDRADIIWVADADEEKAHRIAVRAKVPALADYRDGLDAVDAVVAIVPHHLHHPITMACLAAGKHVLLEKPMALTVAECDAMIAAAEQAGRTLMIAYPHRYRHCMQVFKEHVTGGAYGPMVTLDGCMDESLQGYMSGWVCERAKVGGGVFFSSSPHMLDAMLWIAGPVRHAAMVGGRAGLPIEGEDTAASVIKFASGVIGTTRHTWGSPRSYDWYTLRAMCREAWVTLSSTPTGDFFSEAERCRWDTRIVVANEASETTVLHSDEGLDLVPEWVHFLDCVKTGAEPQTGGNTARAIIELVQNAYREADKAGANVDGDDPVL